MAYTKDFVYYYDLFKSDKSYKNTVKKLLSLFRKHNVKSVLDIGCGTGKADSLLKEKGYEVIGIDNSKEMIEHAKRNYPGIEFKQMEAQSFRLNKEFDAIIALDSVLTYLIKKGDFEKAIKNMVSHMKKGSILYFQIGFTDKLIPDKFTDQDTKSVKRKGIIYRKDISFRCEKNILDTRIKIYEGDKPIIEETHTHRVIPESLIVKLLTDLGCEVKTSGNSNEETYQPLEVIAKKK